MIKKYLAILIFLFSFQVLFYLAPQALAQPCSPDGSQQTGNVICNPAPGLFVDLSNRGGNTFAVLLRYLVEILLPIAGIAAVFFLIWGGYQYIISGTDQESAEMGKKTIRNAALGLVIVILSYVIVVAILNALISGSPTQ